MKCFFCENESDIVLPFDDEIDANVCRSCYDRLVSKEQIIKDGFLFELIFGILSGREV